MNCSYGDINAEGDLLFFFPTFGSELVNMPSDKKWLFFHGLW